MTPTHLRHCIDTIGWSQRQLARVLDRHEGTVRQWARGAVQIPPDVAAWLEALTRAHEGNPVPRKQSQTFEEATDEEKQVGSGSIWERPF